MKYRVHVCRTAYAHLTLEVEADDPKQAEDIALDEAGNHLFSESSSEYSAESVIEVKTLMNKIYDSYSDPGHGWAKVKRSELQKLGILEQISRYSYQKGEYVYLEEDADLTLFVNTQKEQGVNTTFREHSSDRLSRIRSYPSFNPCNPHA